MDSFVEILRGSYSWILIFQILLVTALFLGVLYLWVQRIFAANAEEAETSTGISADALAELEGLREKVGELQALQDQPNPLEKETKALKEKVRYLESKLLEYEILQEEIGTLSALKLENEQLKKQVTDIAGTS